MQYQDILTATIVTIFAAFIAIIIIDFCGGLLHLIKQAISPQVKSNVEQNTSKYLTNSKQAITKVQPASEKPGKQSKRPSRTKKTTTPISVGSPKRPGRPRKTA